MKLSINTIKWLIILSLIVVLTVVLSFFKIQLDQRRSELVNNTNEVSVHNSNNKPVKHVLVVNSYHPGYSWSDDIMKGIQDAFAQEDNVEVYIEYLDTKRHTHQEYFLKMEQLIRHKYGHESIDAIITSDDNALDFVLGIRKTFLSNIPLIFCGIDHIRPERISGYEPIYGVEEIDGTKSTLDSIVSMRPDTHTIFFISDETKTGKVMLENVLDLESSYQGTVKFSYLVNEDMDELKSILRRLPEGSAVLYLSFIRDKAGKVFSIEKSMKFIANNSAVPVYCTWGFKPDTGIMGGSILGGFTQGQLAAQIAIKLLHEEDTVGIARIQKAPLTYMFDYKVMHRYGIGMNDIPNGSIVYNRASTIFEKYKWLIFGIFIFAIFQTILILILLNNLKKRKQVEDKLRHQATLLENISDAVVSVDMDYKIVSWNDAAERIYGWKAEEVLGEVLRDLTAMEYLDEKREVLLERLHRDGFWRGNVMQQRKDGERIFIQATLSLIKDEKGNTIGSVGVNRDITESKQTEWALQISETNLRKAQEVAHVGSWNLDLHDNKLVWTDENYRIFGIPKGTPMTYETFLEVVHPEDRDYVNEQWSAAIQGEPYDIEHRILVDNEIKWVREKVELVFDDEGNPTGGIGITQDITERKNAEVQLDAYQDRLRGLATELTLLEERERRHLAAELHDGPTQLLAYARMQIASVKKQIIDPQPARVLNEISETLRDTMQQIRKTLLVLSSPSMNEIGFTAAIEDWLDEQIRGRCGLNTSLVGNFESQSISEDEKAVLFRNTRELLANVVKHAKAQNVYVRLKTLDQVLQIEVEDDGVGFDSDNLPRKFEKKGFGLFSIQERMLDMGGSLKFASSPGQGCTAILSFPLKNSEKED